jgi:hypothetical protein
VINFISSNRFKFLGQVVIQQFFYKKKRKKKKKRRRRCIYA